jgi:hypothetical protein
VELGSASFSIADGPDKKAQFIQDYPYIIVELNDAPKGSQLHLYSKIEISSKEFQEVEQTPGGKSLRAESLPGAAQKD